MTMTMMATDTTITDAGLLQLIWLASPALPVGGFSYSEGLEGAVEAGLVHDERSAGDCLVDQLHLTLARGDLAVVAAAVEAVRSRDGERLATLDAWVRSTRETSELRQQTEQMGRSLREWQRSFAGWVAEGTTAMGESAGVAARTQPTNAAANQRTGVAGNGPASPAGTQWTNAAGTQAADSHTYPIAFASAAAGSQASVRQIALTFAFSWAENMMQAAIKSVPLGQGAGQRILARLASEIPMAVDHALTLDDESRQAFSPMLAILSARHETQYSRLFRS